MMYFYLVDVLSNVTIDGEKVAFDYINTYATKEDAMSAANKLAANTDTIRVAVHKWSLDQNGNQEHCEGIGSIINVKGV